MFATAARTSLPAALPGAVTPPPPALEPRFSPAALTPLGSFLYQEGEARNPDGVTQVLFARHVGRPLFVLCSLADTAACKTLPESLADYPANPTLLDGSTAAHAVLELSEAGQSSGLYDGETGARLWQNRRVTRGFGLVHGGFNQLAGGGQSPFVLVHGQDGKVAELELVTAGPRPPWMYQYADWLVWPAGGRLAARRVLPGDAPLGPVFDLGALPNPEVSPTNIYCRSPELVAVVARHMLADLPSLIMLGDHPTQVALPGDLPRAGAWPAADRSRP